MGRGRGRGWGGGFVSAGPCEDTQRTCVQKRRERCRCAGYTKRRHTKVMRDEQLFLLSSASQLRAPMSLLVGVKKSKKLVQSSSDDL